MKVALTTMLKLYLNLLTNQTVPPMNYNGNIHIEITEVGTIGVAHLDVLVVADMIFVTKIGHTVESANRKQFNLCGQETKYNFVNLTAYNFDATSQIEL